jgi:hypothetical protein
LLAVGVSALVSILAIYFFIAMPGMIAEGGIPAAQVDFLRLSPVFFPRLTFALLIVLGLTYLTGALRRLPAAKEGKIFKEPGTIQRVLTLYLIAVAYPFLLPWLGYGVTSIFLMGGMTLFLGTRIWWQALAFALIVPVAIRFIFERLLAISLPRAHFQVIADTEEALMQMLVSIFF